MITFAHIHGLMLPKTVFGASSAMGWLLQENTSQSWKCASGQNQKAASRVGSLFPEGEVLGPSPEGWRLICLFLEEAATHCHVQLPPPPPGASFLRQGLHPWCQSYFFPSPRFFQLTSPYFTSLEILCFIIMFLNFSMKQKRTSID